jgi:glycosyltransferase involved in cell wall biosynthesis
MKVVLSTIGKFHTFDLARELHGRGALEAIFSGYPAFKLRHERLPEHAVRTFGWIHAPYMAVGIRPHFGTWLKQQWEYLDRVSFDEYVSRRMPSCDVFVGLSGSALRSGKNAQARGAKYVCDRGSSHIRVQDELLRGEHRRWDFKYVDIDRRIIDREEAEYAASDCITVPSTFALESFVSQGFAADKLRRIPYGVNLERFQQVGEPDSDRFDVLFVGGMSLRKGVPYLLEAYGALQHARKSLTIAGTPDLRFIEQMKRRNLWPSDVRLLGHVSQPRLKEVMSRSHVLVLASVEEGLAMVQAQAMACGCPVIGTENTGAGDLFENGKEGYIVPIRRADTIAERLQSLADSPSLRARLSAASLARVSALGGWSAYGSQAMMMYQSLGEPR